MTFNLTVLLKLLKASELFTEKQKEAIRTKLSTVSEVKQVELQNILENEQKVKTEYYKKLTQIRKRASQKKIQVMYRIAEEKSLQEDEKELSVLDQELAHLPA